MTVYVNGQWLAPDTAAIQATDRGLTLGDGLFETLAVRDNELRRVGAHMARFQASARELGIAVPFDSSELTAILKEAVARNNIADGMARLTVTRGTNRPGLVPEDDSSPTIIITATSRPPQTASLTAIVATITRRNEHSPLARLKTTNYLDNILAAREARAAGVDEALLQNTAGRLAEATAANLFLVIDGRLTTPPVDEGALPGIMRAEVIGREQVVERPLDASDIASASEALLTNSGGIRALVAVDGRAVGAGVPGPVHERLQAIV